MGWIRPDAWNELKHYPRVFIEQPSEDASAAPKVHLSDDVLLGSYESRSCRMAEIMTELRQKNTLVTLKGWRDEVSNLNRPKNIYMLCICFFPVTLPTLFFVPKSFYDILSQKLGIRKH